MSLSPIGAAIAYSEAVNHISDGWKQTTKLFLSWCWRDTFFSNTPFSHQMFTLQGPRSNLLITAFTEYMHERRENEDALLPCIISSHQYCRVLLLTQPGSLHTMRYYSFFDCFVKNITHKSSKWEPPSKRKMVHLFLFILFTHGAYSLFSGSSQQPARRLFFTSTPHLPQSAQWQINPVGLLWVLCLQMARCADGALWCTGDCKGN